MKQWFAPYGVLLSYVNALLGFMNGMPPQKDPNTEPCCRPEQFIEQRVELLVM